VALFGAAMNRCMLVWLLCLLLIPVIVAKKVSDPSSLAKWIKSGLKKAKSASIVASDVSYVNPPPSAMKINPSTIVDHYASTAGINAVKVDLMPSIPYVSLVSFAGFLMLGSYVFHKLENLKYLDALYFSLVTFTTVGYGDFSPQTQEGKVFTCLYVFIGLLLVTQVVDRIVDKLLIQKGEMMTNKIVSSWFHHFDNHDHKDGQETKQKDSTAIDTLNANTPKHFPFNTTFESKYIVPQALFMSSIYIALIVAVGTMYFYFYDNDSFVDSIYLSVMTVSTVGYGDVTPKSWFSKAFTCLYSILGTLAFARIVSQFIEVVTEHRFAEKNKRLLESSFFDAETLIKADVNGDDRVTKNEFILFRLRQMDLIPSEVELRIDKQWSRMDIDGDGELSVRDLIARQGRPKQYLTQKIDSLVEAKKEEY
jgi:potassium channel subfamily K, other eukaryote